MIIMRDKMLVKTSGNIVDALFGIIWVVIEFGRELKGEQYDFRNDMGIIIEI